MLTSTILRTGSALVLVACVGCSSGKLGGDSATSGGKTDTSAAAGGPGGPGATTGGVGGAGSGTGAGAGMATGTGGVVTIGVGAGGGPPQMAPDTPFDINTAVTVARKVKNLLVGLPPVASDITTLTTTGAAGLQQLITTWTTDPQFQPDFKGKMLFFLRNTFQQKGFSATEDFKPQLLENGGFDFGPFGTAAVGDDAFALLVQNLQDSFALTAWNMVSQGQPFINTLTTQQYMMTTALKSLYLQIEMPNDQPYSFNKQNPIKWTVDYSGTAIPLEQTLDPTSPNYMVFDDQPPAHAGGFFGGGANFPTCQGGTVGTTGVAVPTGQYTGYAQLFQRLIGYTPRFPFAATPTCWEHPSKPYFTASDTSDWQLVTVRALAAGEKYIQPFDLPTLRTTTVLPVALPRVGFFTTPAFLAMWNTNDSNQHRVTANQTLLTALGQSLNSESTIVPLSQDGLDAAHSVSGSECLGCHKTLDPLRQFWGNQLDFNDRNDFITKSFTGAAPNPRPATLGGLLAFDDVNQTGASLLDLGPLLAKVTDSDAVMPLSRFAIATAQRLCFYANSAPCDEADPEFRRVVGVFQTKFDFNLLVQQLFASPLVTGAVVTETFAADTLPISVSRRDHFCAALSNRLGKPDLCVQAVALPTTAQAATATIAGSVAADAFSRGDESPVTPSTPTLFFRAGIEMLCENIAPQVVDATTATVYTSTDKDTGITAMVENVMGYPPSDPNHDAAVQILQAHYAAVLATKGNTATTSLRSTFVLACESPTSVSIGL